MASKNGSGWGFMSGLVVGSLLGAALALIFAPQPGAATRTELKRRGVALKSDPGSVTATVKLRANELVDRGKLAVREAKEAARRTREEYERDLDRAQREGGLPTHAGGL
ncbi:MAG: YtxH domain-containing protein [Chloroflexi bacterium]|nr:YtxH domain-containing protein [Chloroflexota bacterium]